VSTGVVKWSDFLNNRVSISIRRYIDHMKFAACVVVSFITYWLYFVSLYMWLYVLYASVVFCKGVFYVCIVLCMFHSGYSVKLCGSVCCLCVNVYCFNATRCQPSCS